MTECPRCGKPNPAEIHTCTPPEVCEAEQKLNDLFEKEGEAVSRIIKKLRKPIENLSDR